MILIKHRHVTGVYLCYGPAALHYWGPREEARTFPAEMARDLLISFPKWELLLGVSQSEAVIEVDPTPVTLPP
jgi:hypothetical protein